MSQNYIQSLPQAFEVIKQMNLTPGWNSDYRFAARNALARILEDRMEDRLDRYLLDMGRSLPDRRNGYFSRHLLGLQYELPNLYNCLYSRCVHFLKSWIPTDVIVVAFIPLCSRANNEKLEYATYQAYAHQ